MNKREDQMILSITKMQQLIKLSNGLKRLMQARCCTPKFALPYSSRNCQAKSQNSSRVAQSNSLPYSQNQGLSSDQENEVFKGPIKSHMHTNVVKHPHTKFQGIQHKIAQAKPKIALQSTVGAKWSFDSQKFKFLVNISFLSHKHHLINA